MYLVFQNTVKDFFLERSKGVCASVYVVFFQNRLKDFTESSRGVCIPFRWNTVKNSAERSKGLVCFSEHSQGLCREK